MKLWSRCCIQLVCVLLTAALMHAQGSVATKSADNSQQRLSNFLRQPLPAGTTAEGQPSSYEADNLFQAIDGGADVYLLYDFHLLLHQDFKNGAAELSADIYDMGKQEDAFGIYAAERSPQYKFAAIGAEGYRSKGVLNFLQDRYYVKLSGTGAGADPLLDQIARLLSGRIGGARTLPPLLAKVPSELRVKHSEQFVRKDPMGHAFLAPAYVVTYASGKQETKLLISVATDNAGAKGRLNQLAKHFKDTGECAVAAELGPDAIRAKNSFEGKVIARTEKRYLIVVFNPAGSGAEMLRQTADHLP